jgi:hypothetical protein
MQQFLLPIATPLTSHETQKPPRRDISPYYIDTLDFGRQERRKFLEKFEINFFLEKFEKTDFKNKFRLTTLVF